MKRIMVVALVAIALAVGLAPPAEARGSFGTGFAVGAATGLFFGTVLAAPRFYAPAPVYYYAPAPVYVAPPPPACYQTLVPGYWTTVPVYSGGYTAYQSQYVPDRYTTVCR